MGELRADTMISPRSTHDRFGVLAHVFDLVPQINTVGAAPTVLLGDTLVSVRGWMSASPLCKAKGADWVCIGLGAQAPSATGSS